MRGDNRPIGPEGADSTKALAFAMVWTLSVAVIAIAAFIIGWSDAR